MRKVGDLVGKTRTIMIPGPTEPVQIQIVINRDEDGRCIEVFIHGVRGRDRAMANAVGRLVSLALANGVDVAVVSRTLAGIGGEDPPVFFGEGIVVRSIPDARSKILDDVDERMCDIRT